MVYKCKIFTSYSEKTLCDEIENYINKDVNIKTNIKIDFSTSIMATTIKYTAIVSHNIKNKTIKTVKEPEILEIKDFSRMEDFAKSVNKMLIDSAMKLSEKN